MGEYNYEAARLSAESMRAGWKMGDNARDAGLRTPKTVARVDNLLYGPCGFWNLMDIYYPAAVIRSAPDDRPIEGLSSSFTGIVRPVFDADGNIQVIGGAPRVHERTLPGGKTGETVNVLPVIVSAHGGGWMYGDKDLYQYYCMSLARRGFAVINYTYRLAPENPFPAAFIDTNRVFAWIAENAERYGLDRENVFLLGDSAGGQLSSWYATLMSSPDFRALYEQNFPLTGIREEVPYFTKEGYAAAGCGAGRPERIPDESMLHDDAYPFHVPADKLTLRAVAHNCGVFDTVSAVRNSTDSAFAGFLGEYYAENEENARKVESLIDAWHYMSADYPPAFIMTAEYDFLRPMAEPMAEHLKSLGAYAEYHKYGEPSQEYMVHVFHCNQYLKEADRCNDDECAFFDRYIR